MQEPKASRRILVEDDRTGMHPITLERAVLDHLQFTQMKDLPSATLLDLFNAVAHATRDRLVHRWIKTQREYYKQDVKRVYYLSAEFLMGRALGSNLLNLGLYGMAEEILEPYEIKLSDILEQEVDAGLGNGGLGRLAACFLDSMATLGLPGYGYGIRYEFGIFHQRIIDGWQVERGDAWLRYGNPWEVARHEYTIPVQFYGRVEHTVLPDGRQRVRWIDTHDVLGVPYDTPVAGFGNNTVNTLRLWSARATRDFDFQVFNDGDYRRAVEAKALSESISKVLYPNDDSEEGKELRLKQQYFFVCCSIADIIRRYKKNHDSFDQFAEKNAIQLNDTHPAIAVAELMRVLVDLEGMAWDPAWAITQQTIAYTNHTLLPEALEQWPVAMFERMLPRHLEIIYEINHRFLRAVQIRYFGDGSRRARMSLINEGPPRQVRMAHLAVVGSHTVNGVAALHSELVKEFLLPDFADMFPDRFQNKTNGVTPRRWILMANPRLADAISDRIGHGWVTGLDALEGLNKFAEDAAFGEEIRAIKRGNKELLAAIIKERHDLDLDLDAIFDVQIKRIHEYKRQLLNCLHIVALYRYIKRNPDADFVPRVFIFGGKAAPGYAMAKLHIKLINDVAATINIDPAIGNKLRVVFLENYGVSLAERIIPAADVSEQVSMAGKEASGTGNMKFMMNGAVTIGTLDGANVEIREAVGEENFFLFGLTVEQIAATKPNYNPAQIVADDADFSRVMELLTSGKFGSESSDFIRNIVNSIMSPQDAWMTAADFRSFVDAQHAAATAYTNRSEWTEMSIRNTAMSGRFSSDRTINDYNDDLWHLTPLQLPGK